MKERQLLLVKDHQSKKAKKKERQTILDIYAAFLLKLEINENNLHILYISLLGIWQIIPFI